SASLVAGTVHLDILAGRESVRGQTGGNDALTIDAGGDVTIIVPAHALPADTAVRVQPAILSTFLPGVTANTAPGAAVPAGEVVVASPSRTLDLAAELTVAAPPDAGSASGRTYLVARVVRVDGVPSLLVVATADVAGTRLVSRGLAGLAGIATSGR